MESVIAEMRAVKVNLEVAAPLRRIFTGPDASRMPERAYYYLTDELKGPGPTEIAPHIAKLRTLGRELLAALPPRALVLEEDAHPPVTRVMLRGNVRTLGDEVQPGVLSALHPLPKDPPPNRLGLARWLASRDNPLTARVMVNRWWSELFGQGLVTTPEDFGLQGESPSHPELLDWLAVDFMEKGWSMKQLLKQVVMSATYQQSSSITAQLQERDAQNRLLARGPRHRLDAELLRDNAFAIAGVLKHQLGGPPVFATRSAAFKANAPFTWRRGSTCASSAAGLTRPSPASMRPIVSPAPPVVRAPTPRCKPSPCSTNPSSSKPPPRSQIVSSASFPLRTSTSSEPHVQTLHGTDIKAIRADRAHRSL